MTRRPSPETLAAARQQQFLEVVDRDTAEQRFHEHLDLSPLDAEVVPLGSSLERVLSQDVLADVDVPAFDRSNVERSCGSGTSAAETMHGPQGQKPSCHLPCSQSKNLSLSRWGRWGFGEKRRSEMSLMIV